MGCANYPALADSYAENIGIRHFFIIVLWNLNSSRIILVCQKTNKKIEFLKRILKFGI
jgi:hypothetical protein